jgi:hypothetical protein
MRLTFSYLGQTRRTHYGEDADDLVTDLRGFLQDTLDRFEGEELHIVTSVTVDVVDPDATNI